MSDCHYNPILVAVSFVIAILASWTALNMAGRILTSHGRSAKMWLLGGSFSMGIGVWSMHFIGMLAMNSAMNMHYDIKLTVLSLVIAITSSLFALWLFSINRLGIYKLLAGSMTMGSGVVAMHYTGMAAIETSSPIIWHKAWVIGSIVIAFCASFSSLWATFHLHNKPSDKAMIRIGAALAMGAGIAGMHYTGMLAAEIPASLPTTSHGIQGNWLATLVSIVTLFILAITLLLSMLDARLQSRTALLASSLTEANKELAQQALQDPLTHLPNRALFEERLEHTIASAAQNGGAFSLMFMDLDGFKSVNDAYGHEVGDNLLIAATRRLLKPLRGQYTLARIGGDEFVLLSDIADPGEVALLASSLVKTIDRPFNIDRYDLVVTLSVGIALYPRDGTNERELMFNADAAMYHTKNSGRNAYSFFQPAMNITAQRQLQLTNDLWGAVEGQQLRLHYQPKCLTPCGTIIGFEALLRWQHPREGLLKPDDFLPNAEKTGVIIPVGHWVINEACRQLAEWRSQGMVNWSMSVNIAPLQFEQPQLLATVAEALCRYNIPPEMLMLEVTETTAMRNPEQSIAVLKSLTELGVKTSIDDFGTGYSSLLYLKRLPASELKIDRAFIQGLGYESNDRKDANIVSTIISLARILNLNVVAEGVETQEQQLFLTSLGCDILQGYYLGKPASAESIALTH